VYKKFKPPLVKTTGNTAASSTDVVVTPPAAKPRHDPTAANALVLKRPDRDHLRRFNTRGMPVVDVVVDPYLSKHLRPHQREGVAFLYECVMYMKQFDGCGAILADEM
jgi:DNA repair and recombination protein RAD54B